MARIPIMTLFLLVTATTGAHSQVSTATATDAQNAIFVEGHVGGTPFVLSEYDWFSIGYERVVAPSVAIGLGVSRSRDWACPTLPDPENPEPCEPTVLRFPLSASWLTGTTHRFELGSGILLGHSTGYAYELGPEGGFLWSIITRVGYRYQPRSGGFAFRAAYAPRWFGSASDLTEFAIGLGYAF